MAFGPPCASDSRPHREGQVLLPLYPNQAGERAVCKPVSARRTPSTFLRTGDRGKAREKCRALSPETTVGDGKITDSRELFGGTGSGFDALAALDGNQSQLFNQPSGRDGPFGIDTRIFQSDQDEFQRIGTAV
jgi:hypothetical protein